MRRIFFAVLMCASASVYAQDNVSKPDYPQGYFRNPLDFPILLAGNFGECRPGHFHSGTDIKTKGVENQKVHAAADGYISRIKMDKGGFGHALYITHPNGYTTLYAHLNDFVPAIEQYLKKEQYAKKHWDVDITLQPSQFPVKQGQQIAWSGNTGGSTAPHLHFEIRNTATEHPLNPELFGLPIVDKTPPVAKEVVIYLPSLTGEGFYECKRTQVTLEKDGDHYALAQITDAGDYDKVRSDTFILQEKGNIGIGIGVDDYMDGSENTIAFYTARLFLDDSLQSQITLDNIGYDETRYVNAYADYKIKQQENKWVQCFFKLPGNHLDQIYSHLNNENGRIVWNDAKPHKVNIIITDDMGNKSSIAFYIRSKQMAMKVLYDAVGAPVSLYPNQPGYYHDSGVSFTLDGRALYDSARFSVLKDVSSGKYSYKYLVGHPYLPVHNYFELKLKPTTGIPAALVNKVAMMYSDGKNVDGRAASETGDAWYKAKVRAFGTYWLDIDTTAPEINAMQRNNANLARAKEIAFEVTDDKTSVKKFAGYLDGKWICFEQHGNTFFYRFDGHCPKGKHKLVFTVEDENGNKAEHDLNFTR